MDRDTLTSYLNRLLEIDRFQDYCPNGLQVQGRQEIRKVVTGVTASLALLEAAMDWKADAVMVHHGFFWRNEPLPITAWKYRRLRVLLQNDINLLAYHLPLDAHRDIGNNTQLGIQLGWSAEGYFGKQEVACIAQLPTPLTLEALTAHVESVLGRKPLAIGVSDRKLQRVAWCTGAAQNLFNDAIAAGADVYISGEVCESTTHLARESGVAYLAAGHHASERYGVQALGEHLSKAFNITHYFIDIDNPV